MAFLNSIANIISKLDFPFKGLQRLLRLDHEAVELRGKLEAIKRTASSDFEAAARPLSAYTDDSLQKLASTKVGDWERLIELDADYHREFLRTLVLLDREDQNVANTADLQPSESIIESLVSELRNEKQKGRKEFFRTLVIWHQKWRKNNWDTLVTLPETDRSAYRDGLCAELIGNADVKSLLRKDAAQFYKAALRRVYQKTLNKKQREFQQELQNEKYQSVNTRKIMRQAESVSYTDFSERFLASDKYLMDRIHRDWVLVQPAISDLEPRKLPNLKNRQATLSEGGSFRFGRNWFAAGGPGLEAKASSDPDQPEPISSATGKHIFVDQVVIPEGIPNRVPFGKAFRFSQIKFIDEFLECLASETEGNSGDIFAHAKDTTSGLERTGGREFIEPWLKADTGRDVAFVLRRDGLMFVEVKLAETVRQISRDEINHVRLVALLVVSTISRSLNGMADARSFPEIKDETNGAIHVPSECVWPIELENDRDLNLEDATDLDPKLLQTKAPQRWMPGFLPKPIEYTLLPDLLAARYLQTTFRHGRILFEDKQARQMRFGAVEDPAEVRIPKLFTRTSCVLALSWFGIILLSLLPNGIVPPFAGRFVIDELEILTGVFVLVCFWRSLAAYFYVASLNQSWREGGRARGLSRIRRGLVVIAFGQPWFMWVWPSIFLLLIAHAFLDLPTLKMFELPGFPTFSRDIGTAGFGSALGKALWALPVLCLGLLNQARLTLYQALTDRGPLQRIERSVNRLSESLKVGGRVSNVPENFFIAADDLLAMTSSRIAAQKGEIERRFGAKSAANVALVALIGLTKPISQLEPDTNKPDQPNSLAHFASLVSDRDLPLGPHLQGDVAECMLAEVSDFNASSIDQEKSQMILAVQFLNCFENEFAQSQANLEQKLESISANLLGLQHSGSCDWDGTPGQGLCNPLPMNIAFEESVVENLGNVKGLLSEIVKAVDSLSDAKLAIEVGAQTEDFFEQAAVVNETLDGWREVQTIDLTLRTGTTTKVLQNVADLLGSIGSPTKVSVSANIQPVVEHLSQVEAILDDIEGARRASILSMLGTALSLKLVETAIKVGGEWVPGNSSVNLVGPTVNLDVISEESTIFNPFRECNFLAFQTFEIGQSEIEDNAWNLGPDRLPGISDWKSLEASLANLAGEKQLFALGLADGQGAMSRNLNLAHRRATNASDAFKPLELIPVSLGSYGWLIEDKLPDGVDFQKHRSVTILACDRPV